MTSNVSFVVRMKVPCVVVHDLHPWIVQDVVVLLSEIRRDVRRNERLDLADHDPLDLRVEDERARRHPGPKPHDQDRFRLPVHQGGEVAEQPLESHVPVLGRRLDLAAHVEHAGGGRQRELRHRHRGVHPLPHVEEFRQVAMGGERPAERDQGRWHRADGQRECNGQGHGPGERYCAGESALRGGRHRRQREQSRGRGAGDHDALCLLRADGGNQDDAEEECPTDGPQRVGSVHPANQAASVLIR